MRYSLFITNPLPSTRPFIQTRNYQRIQKWILSSITYLFIYSNIAPNLPYVVHNLLFNCSSTHSLPFSNQSLFIYSLVYSAFYTQFILLADRKSFLSHSALRLSLLCQFCRYSGNHKIKYLISFLNYHIQPDNSPLGSRHICM